MEESAATLPSQQASLMSRIRDYLLECSRVLKVTKKPSMAEFKTIVQVSGLGIAIIGILGFLLYLIKTLFF